MADEERYTRDGVAIHRYGRSKDWRKPPIIMAHGGMHAGWCWKRWATYLADADYTCYVFDWYGHGDSDAVPADVMADHSIGRVAQQELALLARLPASGRRDRGPIMIGHSMGALAVLALAAVAPVSGLVLVAPVVPMQAKADPVPIDVTFGELFQPPPFEVAKKMFFPAMDEEQARRLHARLQPESSRAVWEATRSTMWIPFKSIPQCPKLLVTGELDELTPPVTAASLARLLGADPPVQIPGQGHSDLLLNDDGWQLGARVVAEWLDRMY